MDFSKNILQEKKFYLKDLGFTDDEETSISLIRFDSHPKYIEEHNEINKSDLTDEEKLYLRSEAVAKYLITAWSGIEYETKEVKYTEKNKIEMMKNLLFRGLVFSIVYDVTKFEDKIGLDLELIEKN